MNKLWAAIIKEFRLLLRDRVGLAIMFLMPIVLVVIITSVQNSTFKMVNEKSIRLIVCNQDTGKLSKELLTSLKNLEMFDIHFISNKMDVIKMDDSLRKYDAMISMVIPIDFSAGLQQKLDYSTQKTMSSFGLTDEVLVKPGNVVNLQIYYNPVLQESFRQSVNGAFQSMISLTESKLMVKSLYSNINQQPMPESFENEILKTGISIEERIADDNGKNKLPNATQHNIPAWTIFAMFFMVISLGGNIVKEKLSGSFIRLKVLPTSYALGLIAKQIVYLMVVMLLVLVIFSIGVWVFPILNLPALNMPSDILGLIILTLVCGWCAISYALCVGVYSETQEQCSGFGAVSVVIMAALGGVFVPAFAMPESFVLIMKCTPFYWSLQSYYSLFLESRKLIDIVINLLPLLICIVAFQTAAFIGLKRKNLI